MSSRNLTKKEQIEVLYAKVWDLHSELLDYYKEAYQNALNDADRSAETNAATWRAAEVAMSLLGCQLYSDLLEFSNECKKDNWAAFPYLFIGSKHTLSNIIRYMQIIKRLEQEVETA